MRQVLILFLTLLCLTAQSQRLTLGILSGTGFSDYHGTTTSGRWKSSAGPVSGVYVKFAVTPVLGIGTEFNFSDQSYRYKPYVDNGYPYNGEYYPFDYLHGSLSLVMPYYNPVGGRWNYSFWRIPLYITLTTPTRLQFSVSAGVYLSFTRNHDFTPQTHNYYVYYRYTGTPNDLYYPYPYPTYYYGEEDPPRHDNGIMYATSVSYPLGNDFRIYAMGRYFIGHRKFISGTGRTGSSELAVGLAYTGFLSSGDQKVQAKDDTLFSRLRIKPGIGIILSHFRNTEYPDLYAAKLSITPSVLAELKLDNTFSLVSGVSFERKGYGLKDSSLYYFRHARDEGRLYRTDTRTDLDYVVIPLMMKMKIGTGRKVYLMAGPYLGIKLNARVTGTASYESSSVSGYSSTKVVVYDDLEGFIKNTDWGWILGTGTEVQLGNGRMLDLSLHYAFGKENILAGNASTGYEFDESDDRIHNGTLTFSAGLSLPIPKNRSL